MTRSPLDINHIRVDIACANVPLRAYAHRIGSGGLFFIDFLYILKKITFLGGFSPRFVAFFPNRFMSVAELSVGSALVLVLVLVWVWSVVL